MNDKDKEAFEKWIKTSWAEIDPKDYPNLLSRDAWQAACEYKQKEIDELQKELVLIDSITVREVLNTNKNLRAENEKLRECVEFYANKLSWYDNTQINGSDQKAIFKDSEDWLIKSIDKHIVIGGKRARQVLKELEEK